MEIPPGQKKFECEHCQAAILVPIDLPATSAPCPSCHQITTSPPLEAAAAQEVQSAPAPAPELAAVSSSSTSAPSAPVEEQVASSERGEQRSGSKGAGMLWGILGLMALALLVLAFLFFKKSQKSEAAPASVVAENPMAPSETVGEAGPSSDFEKRATALLESFFKATSVEQKAKYVIGKEAKIPEMRAFYGEGAIEPDDLQSDFFSELAMNPLDLARGIYLFEFELPKRFKMSELFGPIADFKTRLQLEAPDMQTRSKAFRENYEMEAVRAMVFFKEKDGELLIDWNTYVQTKNRLFRNFIEYPVAGRKGTFRVLLREHVSTLYDKGAATRNYNVVEPAHFEEDSAIIKVKRDSEVGKILEELAWTDVPEKSNRGEGTSRGATVELEWSQDSEPVLKIAKIICWEFLGVGGDPSNLTKAN